MLLDEGRARVRVHLTLRLDHYLNLLEQTEALGTMSAAVSGGGLAGPTPLDRFKAALEIVRKRRHSYSDAAPVVVETAEEIASPSLDFITDLGVFAYRPDAFDEGALRTKAQTAFYLVSRGY